jgi:hypothetical protein
MPASHCQAYNQHNMPGAGLGGACLASFAAAAYAANKTQLLTMPKYEPSPDRNSTFVRDATRATIAQGYALGMNVLVPWDIYIPGSVFTLTGTGAAGDGRRLQLPSDTPAISGVVYGNSTLASCESHCNADPHCRGLFLTPTSMCHTVNVTLYFDNTTLEGVSYARSGAPRYFGNVSDFGDLYGFVRAAPAVFDGFVNATALNGSQADLPVKIISQAGGGDGHRQNARLQSDTNDIYATVRANGRGQQAVHFVDWSRSPSVASTSRQGAQTAALACSFFDCTKLKREGAQMGWPDADTPGKAGRWQAVQPTSVTATEARFDFPSRPAPWLVLFIS